MYFSFYVNQVVWTREMVSRKPHYVQREWDRNHKRSIFLKMSWFLNFWVLLLYGGASGDQKHFRFSMFWIIREYRVVFVRLMVIFLVFIFCVCILGGDIFAFYSNFILCIVFLFSIFIRISCQFESLIGLHSEIWFLLFLFGYFAHLFYFIIFCMLTTWLYVSLSREHEVIQFELIKYSHINVSLKLLLLL